MVYGERSSFSGMEQYSVRMNKADTTGIISSIYDLSLQGCPSRVGIGYAGSKTAVPPDAFPGGR